MRVRFFLNCQSGSFFVSPVKFTKSSKMKYYKITVQAQNILLQDQNKREV